MVELYLQELQYQVGEDPGPWISKLQRTQEAFGYDDASMLLLVELCVRRNPPAAQFVRHFVRTRAPSSGRLQDIFAGFRCLHELCQRVNTARAVKWAMLHAGCKGKHNVQNVARGTKKSSALSFSSSSSSSSQESEEEICTTGEAEVLRFPENSFPITCEHGDFCVNDVLKFDQTLIYNNMSTKEGRVGKAYKRTVVGRVAHIAESVEISPTKRTSTARMSGSFSQSEEEPTYTIEVHWSRGVKPVATSEPFIIKAHSLALLNPVRQRWGNEQNRVYEMEKKRGKFGSKAAKKKSCRNSNARRSAENCRQLVC